MWTELTAWKDIFHQNDKDSSGYIDVTELQCMYKSIGKYRTKQMLLRVK